MALGAFLAFLIALSVTMILIPPLMRLAAPLRFVDIPSERKVHKRVIPRIGGVAMVLAAILAVGLGVNLDREQTGFLLGIAVISLFGAWDDRVSLDYRVKFFGQIIAAGIVVIYGGVLIQRIPFLDMVLPPLLASAVTIFALLGTTNAINLSDGLDGLAGGVSLLSLGTIALLAQIAGGQDIVVMALAVMGSILGFLRFNTHPAFVFMGDTGSQFLGFSLGVLSIVLTQKTAPALSSALPLMLLGLPLVDTLMVIAERMARKRSPFAPDRNHIHHKLLGLGLDHYEAVFFIYVIQAAYVSLAFLLRYQADSLVLSGYVLLSAAMIAASLQAQRTRWRIHGRRGEAGPGSITRRMRWLIYEGRFGRWALAYLLAAILAYLYVAVLYPAEIARDIGILALALLLLHLVFFFARRDQPFGTLERLSFYVASVVGVYLMQSADNGGLFFGKLEQLFFMLLALAVVAAIRYSFRNFRFKLTPLDFLVLFMVLVFPRVSGIYLPDINWQLALGEVIVMFYALELILAKVNWRWNWMRFAVLGILGIAGLRGVFL
jgi:UDP-GlcNAc:undecaprenyl-phosphate/decaprenyl-phosphate GlcNAc-1-phosphate transferase